MKRHFLFVWILCFVVVPLRAWNDTGHKIVGLLTYSNRSMLPVAQFTFPATSVTEKRPRS